MKMFGWEFNKKKNTLGRHSGFIGLLNVTYFMYISVKEKLQFLRLPA